MKVLELIQRSTELLSKNGVDSPRLQAELLLANSLGLPRLRLYLEFDRTLTETELRAFHKLLNRRARREPTQQIIGSTSFCGFEIVLNRHVLVPRPETELLAEQGWQFLNQLVTPNSPPLNALDFGTGSGCLALALALKCPSANVTALDESTEALALAQRNAERHHLAGRIRFLQSDAFSVLEPGARFHLIVGNPPYIPSAQIDQLPSEVRDFEPHAALDGGPDGLRFYRLLAAQAQRFLSPGGRLMLEFGDAQAEPVSRLFQAQNWIVEHLLEDYTRRPRILIARFSDSDGQSID